MKEQGSAAQPAREIIPVKKEVGEILGHIQKLSGQVARRADEIFEENGRKIGLDMAHWFQPEAELLRPIHLRVFESPDAITVRAEVPGFGARNLEVRAEPRRITITGNRKIEENREARKAVYFERCSDQILRILDLPAEVNVEKAVATLKDGILELEMPKTLVAKTVPIESTQA